MRQGKSCENVGVCGTRKLLQARACANISREKETQP